MSKIILLKYSGAGKLDITNADFDRDDRILLKSIGVATEDLEKAAIHLAETTDDVQNELATSN